MTTESMYQEIGIRPEVLKFGTKIEKSLKERFDRIDETAEYNQLKVIHCHAEKPGLCGAHFNRSTGYGYNDLGRETLEAVYADVFHTESALVRPQITCGTHALALALSSNLRPGDELLSLSGKPYDTSGGGHRHPAFHGLPEGIRRELQPGGLKTGRLL